MRTARAAVFTLRFVRIHASCDFAPKCPVPLNRSALCGPLWLGTALAPAGDSRAHRYLKLYSCEICVNRPVARDGRLG